MIKGIFRSGWFWTMLLLSWYAKAQAPYGNEWIRPDHHYLRLGVVQDGLYRLHADDLRKQGIDISTILAKSLKMYRRGKQVPIRVNGELDGAFDTSDYLEFYGQRNDGWLDTLLYVAPAALPHPHYSLYSDTATFFLAWQAIDDGSQLVEGQRIAPTPTEPLPGEQVPYHREVVLQLFVSEYPAGNIYPMGFGYDNGYIQTPYDYGEGWTGPAQQTGQWQPLRLQTQVGVREAFDRARVQILFVGRSAGPHKVEVWTGDATRPLRKLGEARWNNYGTQLFSAFLLAEDLPDSGLLSLAFVNRSGSGQVSASYARWQYPQQIDARSLPAQKFVFPFANTTLPFSDSLRFFDVTQPGIPRQLLASAPGSIASQANKSILIVREPLPVASLRPVKFTAIDSLRTDYLIVSHPLVRKAIAGSADPVADYAAYRASDAGGRFTPLLLNASQVADQFNYGEPGPLGTRRLMRWLHDRARLRYVLLLGRSRSPQIVRHSTNARDLDMIPSAGWPDSDIALGMGLDPTRPDVPLVPIGRINASTPQQVWDYLQKVKQHEAAPPAEPWRKNVLHLSGGRSAEELTQFRTYVNDYTRLIGNSWVAPRLRTISKQNTELVQRFDIAPQINQGVALMTLFGHSSLNITDIDIGFASDNSLGYRNEGRYPAVVVNGCALGNFYFGPTPISTDWILAPNRGAVLFLAHTHNGLTGAMYTYSHKLYETLADRAFSSLGFGDIMREGTRRYMLSNPDISARVTAQQMNLQGDPAIKIFPATRPDYAWDANSVSITNTAGKKLTAWDDSVQIRAHVYNHGRFVTTPYSLRLRRLRGGQVISEHTVSRPGVPRQDTLHLLLPNTSRQGGQETWELLLDPLGELAEEKEDNNLLTVPLSVEEGGALALLPANEAILNNPTIELIAQLPGRRANAAVVFAWSQSPTFDADTRRDTVQATGVVARRLLTLNNPAPQSIYWRVQIVGDAESPARLFRYDPTGSSALPDRPEGIATLTDTYPHRLDEGEVLRIRVSYVNLSDVPFTDSLLVAVREYRQGGFSERYFTIPPLAGKATFHYDFEASTLNRGGANRTLITFNEGRLPELRYINNSVELRYEVVPDAVPPVLDVLVDNRRLTDGEAVGRQPWLYLGVYDSNPHLLRRDTTGLQIRLQPDCPACPEIPVSWAGAQWSPNPTTDFRVELRLPVLTEGIYLLTVTARDIRGNEAAPYVIRFRVADQNLIPSATATPNPASLWVKFGLELQGQTPPALWRVYVYDLNGKKVATLTKEPFIGNNELFWLPSGLPSGMYLYDMELVGDSWPTQVIRSGKILLSR